MVKNYSIYAAKAKLSEIIRLVKKQQKIIITDRGVPVAQITSIPKENKETLEANIKELVESGQVQLASKPPSAIQPIAERPGAVKRFLEDRD